MSGFVAKVVADRSVRRAFWTLVELAAGVTAAGLTGSKGVGAAAVFLVLSVKEFAVRQVEASSARKAVGSAP